MGLQEHVTHISHLGGDGKDNNSMEASLLQCWTHPHASGSSKAGLSRTCWLASFYSCVLWPPKPQWPAQLSPAHMAASKDWHVQNKYQPTRIRTVAYLLLATCKMNISGDQAPWTEENEKELACKIEHELTRGAISFGAARAKIPSERTSLWGRTTQVSTVDDVPLD